MKKKEIYMKELTICEYKDKQRVIEFITNEYPWNKDNLAYFASPIWLNDEWKFEMRRAWAERIYPSKIWIQIEVEKKSQILLSIKNYIEFCKRVMWSWFIWSDVHKSFNFVNISTDGIS